VAYLTTVGAMTLQGPHHVAKQSRTMRVSGVCIASSNSALLLRLWTPCLLIVAERCRRLLWRGWYMGVMVRWVVGLKRALVSSVRLNAGAARDIQELSRKRDGLYRCSRLCAIPSDWTWYM